MKAANKWWPITVIQATELEGWGKYKKLIAFVINGAFAVFDPASNFDDIPECESSSSSSSLSSWQILLSTCSMFDTFTSTPMSLLSHNAHILQEYIWM